MIPLVRLVYPVLETTPQRWWIQLAMIHEWAGHDLMHTGQGERAILQPFIDGCGPWKRYFSDHVVPPSTPGGR